MELRKGQKIPLTEDFLTIQFERDSGVMDIDTSAFLVGANGMVASDDDFVFYGNAAHKSGCIVYNEDDGALKINLRKVPRDIEKISVTATIYEAKARRQSFGQVKNAVLHLRASTEIATFRMENFTVETAIVLCEIYRYKDSWKFNATGAGFSGGLDALCKNFGVEVSDEISAPPEPPKVEPPKVERDKKISERQPSKKTTPPIKLGSPTKKSSTTDFSSDNVSANPPRKKIELKKGQKVSLVKRGDSLGEIVINLNWSQPARSKGFLDNFFRNKGIDLDLCCLYEMSNGELGAIQALGRHFGSLNQEPYIELDGDDRTGSVAAGETIRINGKFIGRLRRILIYTFIYEGAADWAEAQGVVTVKCPNNPELVVRMDEYGSKLHTCAIALLENDGNNNLNVEKVVRFFRDSKEMDDAFSWGLRWTVGRKG